VFQEAFSKLVSNFKDANKKLIIVWGSEKLLKDFEIHRYNTESTYLNVFKLPSKLSIS
jgi:hypothetical protein